MIETTLQETKDRMSKTITDLDNELKRVRTGRASLSLLDGIRVDYYGTQTQLNQMASLSVPESRLIVIQPWDVSAIKEIEKAFPGQKKVTSSEVKIWEKTRKNLEKSLSNLEKNIELFYVAYRVNSEKGDKLMESKTKELSRSVDGVLEPSRKQTERLRPKEDNRSTVYKVKDKIISYIPFIGKK